VYITLKNRLSRIVLFSEKNAHERQISCFQNATLTNAEGLHGCRNRAGLAKIGPSEHNQASARQRLANPSGQSLRTITICT